MKLVEITEFLRSFIPDAKIISNVGQELVYELPGHNTSMLVNYYHMVLIVVLVNTFSIKYPA